MRGQGFEPSNSRENNHRNVVIFISLFPHFCFYWSIAYGIVLCVEKFALFAFAEIVKTQYHDQGIFIVAIVVSRSISITNIFLNGLLVIEVAHGLRSVFRIISNAG